MALYEAGREHLIGNMPAKSCYPALSPHDWVSLSGSDPKNRRWSYHNGGNWPEYYDTLGGRFIGLRANRKQVWSAAATVFAGALLEAPGLLEIFPSDLSPQISPPVAA